MRVLCSLLALCVALGGCASINGYPRDAVDTSADLAALKSQFDASAVVAYAGMTSETQRRAQRDRVVFGRLLAYDAAYADFERDLAGEGNLWGIGGSAAGTILDTASTLAKSARTKTRLSAYGLGVTAFETDASKQLFYEKTLPAVLSQMRADRLKARLPIEEGLTRTDAEYSLMKALVDLKSYANAGSIVAAVSSISQAAENDTDVTGERIAEIRQASYICDQNCERIRDWAYDAAQQKWDPVKVQQIQQQLQGLGIDDPFIMVVTTNRKAAFAGARATIVTRLNVP